MMPVHVEFFGLVRKRAGVERVDVEADSLGAALRQLAQDLPGLSDTCIEGNRLLPGYIANINGTAFVTDPATPMKSGDSLLILSADAGG